MRIAITGSHRVGKTTLGEALLEQLPGYVYHMEPYYELEASGYTFADTPDVDDFIKQFDYSVKQLSASGDNAIFDRCPIDILAYIHAIDRTRNIQPFFETAQEIIATIDLLVFVSIETPDLITCQPSDLPALRTKVDDILHDWISDFDIDHIEVSGTLLHRKDQVLNIVL